MSSRSFWACVLAHFSEATNGARQGQEQRVSAQRLRITLSNTRCRAGSILAVSQYGCITPEKTPTQNRTRPAAVSVCVSGNLGLLRLPVPKKIPNFPPCGLLSERDRRIPLVMSASGILLCFLSMFHWFRFSCEKRAGVCATPSAMGAHCCFTPAAWPVMVPARARLGLVLPPCRAVSDHNFFLRKQGVKG